MNAIRLHTLAPAARQRAPWAGRRRGRWFVLLHPEMDRRHLRRTYRTARRAGVPADLARYLVVEAAEVFAAQVPTEVVAA